MIFLLNCSVFPLPQYLNFKLTDVSVVDEERFPHMVCASCTFLPLFVKTEVFAPRQTSHCRKLSLHGAV